MTPTMHLIWWFGFISITYIQQTESSPILPNRFVRKQTLSYPNHPYNEHNAESSPPSLSSRKILQSTSTHSESDAQLQDAFDDLWSNIRITPFFDHLDNTTDAATALVLKHRISAAIRYFEQFTKVVHTDKPLRLSKTCEYIPDPSDPAQYTTNCTTTCGNTHFVIPSEHLDSGWIVDEADDMCSVIDVDTPGLGIAETDLVVYVSNEDYRCIGRSWQTVCEQDQFGRPIAILVNFCNVQYTEDESRSHYEDSMGLTMHELTHGLIFNRDYFADFRNPLNGEALDEEYTIQYMNDSFWITSPEVQRVAQDHFGCDGLPGVALDESHYHWSGRMLNTELMNNDGYYLYLSKFTMALMKDSGWYRIDDYSYAQPFYFGSKAGCYFVYGDCIDKEYRYSVYPEFWCDSEEDIGCFYDYSRTSTKCLYSEDLHDAHIPFEFQYFGYSSIGGPKQTDYCPFLSATHGERCVDRTISTESDAIDQTFAQTFGDSNSRCVQTNAGGTKLTAACFNVLCMDWNEQMKGYDHVIINVNDGVHINQNVTCYRNDEGAALNVVCPEDVECLSITCPYIDVMCGNTQEPFKCYYGHYDDRTQECICDPGYKGDTCENRDLGIETFQLYSSSDPILITYYRTLCIYGLQWGDEEVINQVNGVWQLDDQSTDFNEYNPVYVNTENEDYIIYYTYCDETWYLYDQAQDLIIAKCYHNRFDWTDYGAMASCSSFWYIDHDLNGEYQRDINVLMSTGDDEDSCNELIQGVEPFADYPYICVEEDDASPAYADVSGTYELNGVYNGYNTWHNANADDRYLSFEGASWHIHHYTNSIDDWYYICYGFDSDPVLCNGNWFGDDGDYESTSSTHTLNIFAGQCEHDHFPTAPSLPTPHPTAKPTPRPIVAAEVINDVVCFSHAGGSFDGTYVANGTWNDRQRFIKPYLPQLNRPFVYLFYGTNGSWMVYRDVDESKSSYWFLQCALDVMDVTECSANWITSWSGNEPIISIASGECSTEEAGDTPTPKPTNHPITESQVNMNYLCVMNTGLESLDGSYAVNGTFNDRDKFKKSYAPDQGKPWVYIKFETKHEHWDQDGVYGWVVYRKLNTQNFYFYCDIDWADHYYNAGNHEINEDPTVCNGHWITNWDEDGTHRNNITMLHGLCAQDIIVPETLSPTKAPVEVVPSTTKYCGSQPLDDDEDTKAQGFYDAICLNNVEDESLSGVYKLNGSYNGYPAYIKSYLAEQNKPFVYIKYEDVVIGDADADGTVDTRRQWIVYRSYCAQSYYLYCQHSVTSSDINECSGLWHTSWAGRDVNISSTDDLSACKEEETASFDSSDSNEEEVIPDAICMSNTGTESLNGRYEADGNHNGHLYYKKEYVGGVDAFVYIKYGRKWMIFNDLDDDNTYFLECDASIDDLDVTQCHGKWKGSERTPDLVSSVDCSDSHALNTNTISARQRRQIVIALVICLFVCLLGAIWCFVWKQRSAAKHKFNRIGDDEEDHNSDDNPDTPHIESVNVNDSSDDDAAAGAANLDGIGGGLKQTKTSKLTDVFRKITSSKASIFASRAEENVELVSGDADGNQNGFDERHLVEDEYEDRDEENDENGVEEFTSELADNDEDDDDDMNLLNASHNSDNLISLVSPHNRLECD
eukprot:824257_1